MELWLYITLLVISLFIVALYFLNTDHAELGIVGFTFIFILSFVMIAGDIQYKTGINETYTYGCLCCEQGYVVGQYYDPGEQIYGCTDENASLEVLAIEKVDVYSNFTAGGILSRTVGYWLAVLAVVGMIGVFVGLRPEGFFK